MKDCGETDGKFSNNFLQINKQMFRIDYIGEQVNEVRSIFQFGIAHLQDISNG